MFKIFKRYYSFIFRYKWRCLAFAVSLLVSNIAWSFLPTFYRSFTHAIIEHSSLEVLLQILFAYIGMRFLELIGHIFTYAFADFIVIPSSRDARIAVVKKIQELDFAFHVTRSTGGLISAIKRGDGAFFGMNHALNIQLAGVFLKFIFMVYLLSNVRWQVAVVMVLSFIFALLVSRKLIMNNVKRRSVFNDAEDEISGIIVDNMINYETVKLFGKEEREIARLRGAFVPWSQKLWSYFGSFRSIDITIGAVVNISLFLLLLFAVNQVADLRLSVEEFIYILGFVTSFFPQFFEMVYEFRNLAKQFADIEIYFSFFDKETLVKDPEKPVLKKRVNGELEFKNITFFYPEIKSSALQNLSLNIRQGESVAFVGRSGVGKTTLVKLLMRFYDVQKGKITIDGVDIRDFTKSQLRRFIGVVPQEPVLFNDTIGFNIAYGALRDPQGKQTASDKQAVEAAVRMAHLEEFISKLPKKYETMVGERGVKLSGGQKQRLAIARMILADPDIVVFDEATSQLDSESEKAIQDAFWKARENKTTIIIAHRLSTVVRADKIVVMEKGKIVEVGSHRALISKEGGLYKKFWELQVDAFE